ncbi:MAG: TerC family protein [Planctomycetes bacterium]|nr:TerC family protein [Planctomycetota bacterium]
MLVLDLKVFHKEAHEVKTKEALGWSIFWIGLALVFNAALIPWLGGQKATEFLTAYLLEKSLSVDNLFVFVVLFSYFRVPGAAQHRVLFFGVLGAIVLRLIFILIGAELLTHFEWMTYVFGGFLVLTAAKLAFAGESDPDPSKNLAMRLARRWFRFTDEYDGQKLMTVRNGVRYGTPLLLVLLVIEATDVVFAVDSVPACLAVSRDPFIVFTSNIFAILGLRALYFLLARFLGSFRFLKYGLAVVLGFVGVKMIIAGLGVHMQTWVSLAVIGGVLAISTVASLMFPVKPEIASTE